MIALAVTCSSLLEKQNLYKCLDKLGDHLKLKTSM